jgi:hypothetical protein
MLVARLLATLSLSSVSFGAGADEAPFPLRPITKPAGSNKQDNSDTSRFERPFEENQSP